MSSVYIHIPFCKQACHYCNFHFSTSLKYKDEMIEAIIGDINLNHDFLKEKQLVSIYFGGGTPSLLSKEDIEKILLALSQYYTWNPEIEITLEANPDDLNPTKLQAYKEAGINRLSIGIQSFHDDDLRYMNRAHDSQMAKNALALIKEAGFSNITADLIYGTPSMSDDVWKSNIETLLAFDIPHISSYALTVEPGTALNHFIRFKSWEEPDDEQTIRQYELLIDRLEEAGYRHYEISNFARPGWEAVHNSRYWERAPFLGVGPSAHGFDGEKIRRWNIANNAKYIKQIKAGNDAYEYEILSDKDAYNEYIMTGWRLSRGIDVAYIKTRFPERYNEFLQLTKRHLSAGLIQRNDENNLILTRQGKFLADKIASDYFSI